LPKFAVDRFGPDANQARSAVQILAREPQRFFTATADKTRSAVKAVKMAATVPAKGVMLAASAGTAVLRKITGSGNSAGNKPGTTVASAVPGTTATQAGGSATASNTASRVPGSTTPGKSGPTNTGGTPT
jgi:hypothetical protein